MKIAPKFHIERAMSDDPTRAILASAYIDCQKPEQHLAIATNGRLLVAVPIDDVQDCEPGKMIPPTAFKTARKLAGKNGTSEIVANGVCTFADGSTAPIPEHLREGNFPNWRQVVPRDEDRKGAIKISFDPAYLADIAAALGVEKRQSITIEIAPDTHNKSADAPDWNSLPFKITSSNSPGAFAVLMPMRPRD